MTPIKFEFDAIGTRWVIDLIISQNINPDIILNKVLKRIDLFDKTYSRFRNDSLVTQIAHKKGLYIFPNDAHKLFNFYYKMYKATDNSVTPLIGQALSDAGYDAEYSLKPHKLYQPPLWEDVLNYDHPKLNVKNPVLLDFGAAGKGYLIDIIAQLLNKNKIHDFCVDAGGDIKK
jgi:FAD:protein FMN transferase